MSLGKKISYLRKLNKLTQQDLAIAAGVSQSQINKIERNVSSPSTEVLQKIAKALNTYTSELLGENSSSNEFVKENIDLIRGNLSYEEMSKDIGVKLKQPMFSTIFSATYLKDLSRGNVLPDENRLITLSKYAQVPIEFFYQKNNTAEEIINAKEKYKKLELEKEQNDIRQKDFSHLRSELIDFIADPKNAKYVEFAKQVFDKGIDPDDIYGFNLKLK